MSHTEKMRCSNCGLICSGFPRCPTCGTYSLFPEPAELREVVSTPDPTLNVTRGLVSSKQPRLSLLTYHFLCRVAERCEEGIRRKGEDKAWNNLSPFEVWQAGTIDIDGGIERCSHIMNHAARLIKKLQKAKRNVSGVFEMGDDDAAAIGWGAMFLCELTRAIGPKEYKDGN